MRIEDEKLIALLVKKTGQSEGKVKDQLDQLKNRIMRAARTGGVVEISDFGTFATKNNVLDFVPSKQLKTEINQKYAGMRAIEIMEAYKTAGTEVPVDERRYEPPVPSAVNKKTSAASKDNSGQESEEDVFRRAPKQKNASRSAENNGDFEQMWQEKQKEEKERANAYRERAIKESDESEFQRSGGQNNRAIEPEPYAANTDKNNSSNKLFLAALSAVVILLIGWLLFDSGMISMPGLENSNNVPIASDTTEQAEAQSGPETQTPIQTSPDFSLEEQTTTQQAQQSTASPESADSAAGPAVAGEANQQEAAGDEDTQNIDGPQQPAAAERYGLRGSADGTLQGEFTIIVHSFRLRSTVEDLAVQLNEEGYRTLLSESVGADGSRWRLGLGQFPTEQAAEQAAQQLPEPYINNYFIDQI